MKTRSACLLLVGLVSSLAHAAEPVRYARDIRPILADNCFSCHGPDAENREADLRLDTAEGQQQSGAVVPGLPDQSTLIARILSTDDSERMPPPHTKRILTEKQKELLRQWIAAGAPVEGHWAFIAPTRPALPDVRAAEWVRTPIDRFVLAELEARGWTPAPEASRATLIRRLSFDLTGLPPTPEEVRAFMTDPAPDAYERLVDRLLASPRFGERFAQVWLDVARYADTNGYNNDEERVMWRWRDWVISAFNRNLPYDQFVTEQLAGDLLENPSLEQRIATGFNRNHVLTTEGGIIDEEYRVEYVADRVQTTCNVLLGLTLQCARCHDHKYDPISQREYFQLFAFFNHSPDKVLGYNQGAPATPYIKAPTADQQHRQATLAQQHAQLEKQLAERRSAVAGLMRSWEQSLAPDSPLRSLPLGLAHQFAFESEASGGPADAAHAESVAKRHGNPVWGEGRHGQSVHLDGQSFLEAAQTAAFERTDPISFSVWVYRAREAAGTIISKMHDSAGNRGFDVLVEHERPIFHLIHHWPDNAIKVIGKSPLPINEWQHLCVTYDGSSKAAGVKLYVNGQLQEVETAADALSDTVQTDRPFHIGRRGEGLAFEGRIDELQIFRRVLTNDEAAQLSRGEAVTTLGHILDRPADQRTADERQLLERYYFDEVDTEARGLRSQLADIARQRSELEARIPTALIMEDMAEPRTTHLLERGQYDRPGEEVTADVPASLPNWEDSLPRNRLGLARWLLAPDHPLTARVAVNRWWAVLFGMGLVETEEDFGIQGSLPSHPALLDWLAVSYAQPRSAGDPDALEWDTKALVRRIVLSATYRQSSRASGEQQAADPANRWLARGPRFRLAAEQVRDAAMASAGLLVERQGGPSVFPYQPPGLWEEVSVERRVKYEPSTGAGLYRRSLYTYWKRTCAPPGMTVLDAPDREFCVIRRARTNTPLQALALMNDTIYVESARHLGEHVMRAAPEDFAAQLEAAFQRVLARSPDEVEQQVFRDLYEASRQKFAADPSAAEELLAVGSTPRDPQFAPIDSASWTVLANLLLNLDEALTKE